MNGWVGRFNEEKEGSNTGEMEINEKGRGGKGHMSSVARREKKRKAGI